MYAVIETGGKQYKVTQGDVISVEKLGLNSGEKVTFDKVLALSDESGLKVGTPYLDGVTVEGTVQENGKAKKVIIFKYKAKKDYRKKQGHRQPFTSVEIVSLNGVQGAPKEEKEEAAAAEEPAKKVSLSMKKEELVSYAKEHGIDVDEKATKAVILEAIENAEA
ncbi:MAG: 50S ribosomal protein L21 [Eubacteriales bacterium]|nr:50S ribosomal protein L21 [Eubacteriales bacterium]